MDQRVVSGHPQGERCGVLGIGTGRPDADYRADRRANRCRTRMVSGVLQTRDDRVASDGADMTLVPVFVAAPGLR